MEIGLQNLCTDLQPPTMDEIARFPTSSLTEDFIGPFDLWWGLFESLSHKAGDDPPLFSPRQRLCHLFHPCTPNTGFKYWVKENRSACCSPGGGSRGLHLSRKPMLNGHSCFQTLIKPLPQTQKPSSDKSLPDFEIWGWRPSIPRTALTSSSTASLGWASSSLNCLRTENQPSVWL